MRINKDSHVFTIFFTFAVTLVLVFPLTLAFVTTKPIADNYWRLQHWVKTLRSMGISADAAHPHQAERAYQALKKYTVKGTVNYDAVKANPHSLAITRVNDEVINKALQDTSYTGNLPIFFYSTVVDGQKRWAGDFTGPGLWGNVSLAVGVNADGSQITGVQVLFDVETPGLGGRIGEPWFTGQFKGLETSQGVVFNPSGQKLPNGMDAIAGATITSTAVRDILNNRALILLKAFIAQKGGQS